MTVVSATLGYRPGLDGIRALAIVPVVGLHAFGWPREGSLGVEIFFVLSGFLITTLLLEERAANGTIAFGRFYRRRAARLVPALLLMLAVYAIASRGAHAWAFLVAVTYSTNIANAVDTSTVPWSLSHLWSLAQEEQFYLVWPPLLLLLTKMRASLLPKALGLLILGLFLEKFALVAAGASLERIYFAPDTHAEPILIGCLFGAQFRSWRPAPVVGPFSLIAVLGGILAAQWTPFLIPLSPIRTAFFVACGFLVLAAAQGGLATTLGRQPLVFVGRISYSLYLWHVPIVAALGAAAYEHHRPGRAVVAIGIAVAVATGSFFLVEQPAQRRFREPRRLPEHSHAPRGSALPELQGVQ
jgi:peptidoglycan/LPS O-acetylase OafA/YrhL